MFKSLLSLSTALSLLISSSSLTCLDEEGNPIEWYISLKYPKGGEYIYADSNSPKFRLSSYKMTSSKSGSMSNTLNRIYNTDTLGYVMYNDEPTTKTVSSEFGHSKGVVSWDTDGLGFWLIHSIPKFPSIVSAGYSGVLPGETLYGQSVMCVSLEYDSIEAVGTQLSFIHPAIYDSRLNSKNINSINSILNNEWDTKIVPSIKTLDGISGTQFLSFAKNGQWGQSLYPDLVAPTLKADIAVESWVRGQEIVSSCGTYSVQNVKEVTFPKASFKETADHSKWVCSISDSVPVVCIGGINQMTTQNIRGGGTLCLENVDLWGSFRPLITTLEPCPGRVSHASHLAVQP